MNAPSPVGLIGIGLMGEVYARRLTAAGFSVIGFDIDPAKGERLAAIGGRAASIAEIAETCEPIVLAVFNTDQVEDVVERALVPGAAGKIVLCTSTCDPDRIAGLAARVGDKLRFLETPVSGTSEQVRAGDGVGLIGGDASTAQAAAPVLDALFPKRFHIGKAGDGGRAKLAVNHILALNRLALAEGLVFASRLGLDPAAFLKVARNSAAASQVMDTKGPKMIAGEFSPEGPRAAVAQGRPSHARSGAQGQPEAAASGDSRAGAGGLRGSRRGRARQLHRHRGDSEETGVMLVIPDRREGASPESMCRGLWIPGSAGFARDRE